MKNMSNSKTLLDCVRHWENNQQDRIFLTQPMGGDTAHVKTWTWKEAIAETRRMAAYLKSLDFQPRSHIAICSKNCAHWIMADLAIWMAGHVSVPVFTTLTADMVRYTLEHSDSKMLFAGKLDPIWDEMEKGVPEAMPKVAFPLAPDKGYEKWDDITRNHEPLSECVERSPDEMATIIYTSGSTGKPKGVMLSFGAMHECAKNVSNYLGSTADDRMLSYLPLAHVFERYIVEAQSIYAGFQLYFAESLDTFIQDLQRARPTLFISVPRLWLKFQLGVFQKVSPEKLERLLKIPILKKIIKHKILTQLGLNHVRFAGSGSAPIPKEIIEWYRNLGLELLEGYGMTEHFAYSHISKPGEVRPGYVGPPLPGVEHKISEQGELLIKSPGNMMGYYKMPGSLQESFTEDGFLKTGDRGEIDEKGRLKITGRAKEIFKTSKGKYVAPTPIENFIATHRRIEACCVMGSGCPQPYAVLVLSEDARNALANDQQAIIESELAEHLVAVNGKLPPHEHLAFLAVSKNEWQPENGFLTPTMKIKRAAIEKAYGNMADAWFGRGQSVIWET